MALIYATYMLFSQINFRIIFDIKCHKKGFSINLISFFFVSITVPPNIDDTATSSDAVAREGANVTLKCTATGSPKPTVKWKRDDNSKISINKTFSGM